ncbi:MAG: hypothetical protein ACNI3A_15800 [Desulfovibrio sp.]|uniref:hypothetical protein n=1 Tax=Desulfovibrio sp. 7SRBS1 TaxID=3378064 RepID=UPI003B40A986
MNTTQSCIRLHLPANTAWVGLVQNAAEQAGAVFGLDPSKTLRLVNCAEELLQFLASAEAGEIEITLRPVATGVEIGVSFPSADLDLSALNMVSSPNTNGEEPDWMSLPLLLASRMSDGFRVGMEGRFMEIVLRVDKAYPDTEPFAAERVQMQGQPTLSPVEDAQAIFEACSAITTLFPGYVVADWCICPGKTGDQLQAGEIFALEARDAADRQCGIILWTMRSEQSVNFYGPYDFTTDNSVAEKLINGLLQAMGRTKAKIVFSSLATQSLAEYGFELLAELPNLLEGSESPVMQSIWGRMLQEDFGGAVWTHPEFSEFLQSRYDALELVRDMRPVTDLGEALQANSVIGVRLNPRLSQAILSPELNGADMGENLSRHVTTLTSAGYRNIFFEIDLTKGWQAAMGGHLTQCAFQPELLLPHGRQSDTLTFRHVPESR